MLALIDESGDCGLRFDKGSSPFFTCVAVVFGDRFSADACDRSVDTLRYQLGKTSKFEFHFSHCPDNIKRQFLNTVVNDDFRYAGFVVDKKRLYGERFYSPTQFYEFSVGIVCQQIEPMLENSKIIIDKNGNRDFRKRLTRALKSHVNDRGVRRVKKVTMEGSHSNNLLQVADMICGAVSRSYTADDNRFRDIVRRTEKFVQLWPQ